MKTIKIIIEKSADFYDGYAENAKGIFGAGSNVAEVKKSINEAIEVLKQEKMFKYKDYKLVYKYDIQSFFKYYSNIFSMPALERLTGIHQKQLHHYAMGKVKPREAQKKKIIMALHKLGHELIAVQL